MISRIIKVGVRGKPKLNAEADNPYSTKIILDISKTESNNCFNVHEMKKNGSHVFASSITGSNTKHANLT